ncbi:MAG: hypothetical protein R2849_22905 [Thermomicrobiales bacterium]
MSGNEVYDPISLRILWNRLIAIVDEAAATLRRTFFRRSSARATTSVRPS